MEVSSQLQTAAVLIVRKDALTSIG